MIEEDGAKSLDPSGKQCRRLAISAGLNLIQLSAELDVYGLIYKFTLGVSTVHTYILFGPSMHSIPIQSQILHTLE